MGSMVAVNLHAHRLLFLVLAPSACGSEAVPQEEGPSPSSSTTDDGESSSSGDDSTSTGNDLPTSSSGADESASSSGGPPMLPPPTLQWRTFAGPGHATGLCLLPDDRIAVATSSATSIEPGGAAVRVFDPDGDEVWSTGFGESGSATYVHALSCAPDGSIYAVGLEGDSGKWSSPKGLMAKFDPSGDIVWLDVAPEVPSSIFQGIRVDEAGFYVVGWHAPDPFVARYDPDGIEQWRRLDGFGVGSGMLHDVLVHDGVLYAVGESNSDGWFLAMSEDGQVLTSETFGWTTTVSADILAPNPDGGVLVVGFLEQFGFDPDFAWVLPCNAQGCGPEPMEGAELDALHGFALAADGQWVFSGPDRLAGRIPGTASTWTYDTEFDWSYTGDGRKLLAVDSTGALVVVGGDPAYLLRLDPSAG